jgi:phosphoribosyl-ATP pyrophosphohydrolase
MANDVHSPKANPDVLNRLWSDIDDHRDANAGFSEATRLLDRGTTKVAQKFGEEALECLLQATGGHRDGVIGKSADLLNHLLILWVDAGIRPHEIWTELERRERAARQIGGPNGSVSLLLKSVELVPTKAP